MKKPAPIKIPCSVPPCLCGEELARLRAENLLLRQSLGIQHLLRAILETPSKPSTPRRKATKPQR